MNDAFSEYKCWYDWLELLSLFNLYLQPLVLPFLCTLLPALVIRLLRSVCKINIILCLTVVSQWYKEHCFTALAFPLFFSRWYNIVCILICELTIQGCYRPVLWLHDNKDRLFSFTPVHLQTNFKKMCPCLVLCFQVHRDHLFSHFKLPLFQVA